MSVNKVILIGNVGRDPEVRYLDSGIAVASLPLATTDRAYTLANGTQVPERTEWHNLVLWRGLVPVHTMIRPAQSAMLRKSLWTLWKC